MPLALRLLVRAHRTAGVRRRGRACPLSSLVRSCSLIDDGAHANDCSTRRAFGCSRRESQRGLSADRRGHRLALHQRRYRARALGPAQMGMKDIAALWISMCACVPTYMLASGLIAEGHELVAGRAHHLPRQLHRAHADGAQRARGHEVRHPVPRLLPAVVRHPRGERARAAAGARGLRLVRHPGVDRRVGHLQDPGGLRPVDGAAAADAGLGINVAPARLLPVLLGRQHVRQSTRASSRSAIAAEHQGACS